MKRPAFWILLGFVFLAASAAAFHYFPQAFSIVALDITMDRERALTDARAIMTRDGLGPSGYRQAASFALDEETQTFVELEGGGKEAFTRMLRGGLYAAYTWRVRQFKEGETNETLIRFTPDGRPYGFVERLKEDAPGPALDPVDARSRAESEASSKWQIDFGRFGLVEQGQERRPGGRVDHTLTYERQAPTLNEGRYRLRLVVSGDRLTELTHFVKIPQAFTRRYQNMRSANEAIGIASVVAMALLYVIGGIGVGLFFMLRRRSVLWRLAAVWGAIIALLQVLAAANEWPLLWMTYDTALPRSTFLAQQIALLVAIFIGLSAFFALTFMAAETLTRRAFGSHPQLWRVWGTRPGSSTAVLGRTAGGYLLVSLFFAYDVGLYLIATRAFGWWTPSEALLHPDVLATYVPWLSAIANSAQAGFWEESLFRAVPIAGAALIGDRFGQRRIFIVIAFIVQAIVFGAGHAPYPTQPSFARPVELIVPSIGFGLIYLYFGLLPGIILHFTFDVIWFALPIFLAKAPGIWIQQTMVVVLTLVPLWVVLWRRLQVGHWTILDPGDRNAAWTPPAAVERQVFARAPIEHVIGPRAKVIWLGAAATGLAVCGWVLLSRTNVGALPMGRVDAANIARRALEERGVTLGKGWRVMPVPEDGTGGAQEFVAETAGNERRRELLGVYLPKPRWRVRVATFEGDVEQRAEEWLTFVSNTGEVPSIEHTLPEARPGASLDEHAARRLTQQTLLERRHLDVAAGQAREISARPSKLKARIDWTFAFVDRTISPLPKGEPRVEIVLAGDEVAAARPFIFIPEDWQRQQRAAATRNVILRIVAGLTFGGLLVTAAITGGVAWSRRRYAPRLFLAAASLMLIISVVTAANGLPTVLASLQTSQPLQLQLAALMGLGLAGLTIRSVVISLAIGALPHRLVFSGRLSDRDALQLGIAAGLFGAALAICADWLRTPAWAQGPDVGPLASFVPFLQVAVDPIVGFLMRTAIILSVLSTIDVVTSGWTRRRVPAALVVLLVGFLAGGTPVGSHLAGWLAGSVFIAMGLLVAYIALLRSDLTMVPLGLGTMTAIGALARGVQRPFPGALPASVLAAALIALVAWWWFRALRRSRARVSATG